MDTHGSAGAVSVPRMVEQGLHRTERALNAVYGVRAEGSAAKARKMARIAELCEREARWWGVLERWTYLESGLPLIFGRAGLVARAEAAARAERYRELESGYWQRALAVAADSGVAA
ncbi:hypothetical protein BAY59_03840 [Prauserella coralliicola]|nr:hypothetical protein BAY59_03840 [Prauserella coralliicola]